MVGMPVCYICGQRATTKDHVIPNGMFPSTSVARRIKAPACVGCNAGYSADEEYFRTALVAMQWFRSPIVHDLFVEKVVPSFERDNTALRRSFLQSMQEIAIDTGREMVSIGLVKLDAERMDRVVGKIARGLFYHIRRERLPDDSSLTFHWMPKEPLYDEARRGALLNVDPEVFSCRYRMTAAPPHASVWWMLSYRKILYVVTIKQPLSLE
jgi:hypothetical protein